MSDDVLKNFNISVMPDGRLAPSVMTPEDTIKFLRLDGNGKRTLKYFRDRGMLRGVRLGKKLRYRLIDVENFLRRKAGAGR